MKNRLYYGDNLDEVFNYPTLAECYRTAAFDGINRLIKSPRQYRQFFPDTVLAREYFFVR